MHITASVKVQGMLRIIYSRRCVRGMLMKTMKTSQINEDKLGCCYATGLCLGSASSGGRDGGKGGGRKKEQRKG